MVDIIPALQTGERIEMGKEELIVLRNLLDRQQAQYALELLVRI